MWHAKPFPKSHSLPKLWAWRAPQRCAEALAALPFRVWPNWSKPRAAALNQSHPAPLLTPDTTAARAETLAPCLEYLADPVNHTAPEQAGPVAELRVCVEARATLLGVLARNPPASLPAKAAGYRYIVEFGAACRLEHLPWEGGARAPLSTTRVVCARIQNPVRAGQGHATGENPKIP